jgi:hypothetical protein
MPCARFSVHQGDWRCCWAHYLPALVLARGEPLCIEFDEGEAAWLEAASVPPAAVAGWIAACNAASKKYRRRVGLCHHLAGLSFCITQVTLAAMGASLSAQLAVTAALTVLAFSPLLSTWLFRRRIYLAMYLRLQEAVWKASEEAAAHQPPCRLYLDGGEEASPGCLESTPRIFLVVEA